MRQSRIRRVMLSLLGCAVVMMLAAVGLLGVEAGGQKKQQQQQQQRAEADKDSDDKDSEDKDSKAALPVEQVIACIRTAVAAKPGDVLAVEAEVEDGKTLCEVEILAQDRKTYEVEVDVATNTVVEIEEDND